MSGADAGTPDARCPRCGGRFHCGAADATPCACSTLVLAADLLAQLQRCYHGCLCTACLRELAAGDSPSARAPDLADLR